MNINTVNNLNIIAPADYTEKLLFNLVPPKKRPFNATTEEEPDTVDTILFKNRLLGLRIDQYTKYIDNVREQIELNNDKLDKLCIHKWSKDPSEIEKTSYLCGRCGLTR